MNLLELFSKNYDAIKAGGFDDRYLPHYRLKNYLSEHFPERHYLGRSFLGKGIYSIKTGSGKIKVFIWSQMHGNESTGTRAMLDVFNFLNLENDWTENILKNISLDFIPMLNPDGSDEFTRRNAVGIDLNRDFLRDASPEIRILKGYISKLQPDMMFNLHDQRTIYNAGKVPEPATLSFLAPSPDIHRSITDERLMSMHIIGHIFESLTTVIPNKIGRYSDEFCSNSTSDNFMKTGFSNVLIEAGHFPGDYNRNEVRKFNALAILLGLEKMINPGEPEKEKYLQIPENNKKFYDVLIRNVGLKSDSSTSYTDIGILFEEQPNKEKEKIEFIPKISEIGDLSSFYGHEDFDVKGQLYEGKSSPYPQLNQTADFSVGEIQFIDGKLKE